MIISNIPKPNVDSPDEHSIYSPSGSKRWVNCPASIPMIQELNRPEGGSNFYAEEGTAAHELAEKALNEQKPCNSYIGTTINKFIVDKDMARYVQEYVDYVNGETLENTVAWIENRLSLEHMQEGMFGTADAILVTGDTFEEVGDEEWLITDGEIEVVDLKFGRGVVVEAEDNYQMMVYALGVIEHLRLNRVVLPLGFDVKMTIVQPRAPHEKGSVRSDYKTVAQLYDFKKIVDNAIAETKKEDPSFGPTEDGCRWCEFSPVCKALAEHNLKMAALEFKDFELPPKSFKAKLLDKNSISMDQVLKIMEHAKALESWAKGMGAYAIEQLKAKKEVKGYKLVRGRSNRAWKDLTKAEKLLEEYGTDKDRLFTKKFLSPAQAEKELTDDEWNIICDLIHKPDGAITIAKSSDPRPEVDETKEAADDWQDEEI